MVVPEAVLDDTNRFRSSLLPERIEEDGYERGIWVGGWGNVADDVILIWGMLGFGAGLVVRVVTERPSVCHGASIDMLDMSRTRLRSRSSETERENLRGLGWCREVEEGRRGDPVLDGFRRLRS